jgi:predicted nucleic acid-binding protein
VAEFLADKSAVTRRDTRLEVRAVLEPLLLAGRVATCAVVDLELLYSAQNPAGYVALAQALQGMPRVPIVEPIMDRALDIQAQLAARSQHRSVSLPDLIVAACAEHHGLVLLHYDSDFDRVAGITNQPTRWIVPRGTVS